MNLYQNIRDMEVKCCLKDVIDELMDHYCITPGELSQLIGVPYGRILSWRRGAAPLVGSEIFRCAMFFKVPISYLLYGIWEENYEVRPNVRTIVGLDAFEYEKKGMLQNDN